MADIITRKLVQHETVPLEGVVQEEKDGWLIVDPTPNSPGPVFRVQQRSVKEKFDTGRKITVHGEEESLIHLLVHRDATIIRMEFVKVGERDIHPVACPSPRVDLVTQWQTNPESNKIYYWTPQLMPRRAVVKIQVVKAGTHGVEIPILEYHNGGASYPAYITHPVSENEVIPFQLPNPMHVAIGVGWPHIHGTCAGCFKQVGYHTLHYDLQNWGRYILNVKIEPEPF